MADTLQIAADIKAGKPIENAMKVVPSCLRCAFRAPAGKHFVCADLSQIELRVLAWLTNCKPMLDAFANDLDLYIDFASRMYHVAYDNVTKAQRQIAKPAVLSCGYGSGGGMIQIDKNDDEIKTGLWGYAEGMGVAMTQQEAQDAVFLYRQSYPQVPRYWYGIDDYAKWLGKQEKPQELTFNKRIKLGIYPHKLLYIVLPSGRRMNYIRPTLLDDQLFYEGQNTVTHQWCRRRLYGSLLTENIVQAVARDVLAVGMLRAHEAGFTIVAHTHDELLCEEDSLDKRRNMTYLVDMMTRPIEWADGLLMKADAWEGEVYRK